MSSVGSMLGLTLTSRARLIGGREGLAWLAGAALAIGGTGIWTMHFIAMMGFSVGGSPIRYDVPLTALSALIAVAVVGAGLFLVRQGGARPPYLLVGGTLTGMGVACMHYMGMAAMNMSGHVRYDPLIVAASVLIAVVAATVALWFTVRVRGALMIGAAALVMGVAVSGMHYTGMFAMSVEPHAMTAPPPGSEAGDFLVPLLVGTSVITVGLLLVTLLSPSEREIREERELRDRLAARPGASPEAGLFGAPRG
ncbi:MHYT domain-containing protein [Bailinhaonella thermotolerans]|uniref:MHYT domain-containing protein n=1 Tax=Bailinhaonella thermotolerans TaxID=1070861 RepID=UPI001F5BE7AA|nr:MHYT domain-containing protein [Bailinhaonella thermotolerans]